MAPVEPELVEGALDGGTCLDDLVAGLAEQEHRGRGVDILVGLVGTLLLDGLQVDELFCRVFVAELERQSLLLVPRIDRLLHPGCLLALVGDAQRGGQNEGRGDALAAAVAGGALVERRPAHQVHQPVVHARRIRLAGNRSAVSLVLVGAEDADARVPKIEGLVRAEDLVAQVDELVQRHGFGRGEDVGELAVDADQFGRGQGSGIVEAAAFDVAQEFGVQLFGVLHHVGGDAPDRHGGRDQHVPHIQGRQVVPPADGQRVIEYSLLARDEFADDGRAPVLVPAERGGCNVVGLAQQRDLNYRVVRHGLDDVDDDVAELAAAAHERARTVDAADVGLLAVGLGEDQAVLAGVGVEVHEVAGLLRADAGCGDAHEAKSNSGSALGVVNSKDFMASHFHLQRQPNGACAVRHLG